MGSYLEHLPPYNMLRPKKQMEKDNKLRAKKETNPDFRNKLDIKKHPRNNHKRFNSDKINI